ncbi:MAG: 50S ribosomal protein L25 [Sedimentisphaerales bacterium]|nr:50S ribosomal protein L25 [Sedimentisphaerales bacterium]
MAETLVLKAFRRDGRGTRVSRKLREQGQVPAIVYGHQTEPLAVALNYHDLELEIKHHHRLLDVEMDGKPEKLLVKEVQYNYLGDKILHVDLTRVNLDERVKVDVSIELRGVPVGVAAGGVLEQVTAEIEVECAVTAIPENIRVQVNEMKVGDTLTAANLVLPEGVVLACDPTMVIATVRVMAEEPEAVVATEGEETEPEVIIRPKKEEDEAEGATA